MPRCHLGEESLPLSLKWSSSARGAFPVRHRCREGERRRFFFRVHLPPLPSDKKERRPSPPSFPRRYIYPRFVSVYARSGEGRVLSSVLISAAQEEEDSPASRERPKKGLGGAAGCGFGGSPRARANRRRRTCRGCDRVSRQAKWHAPTRPPACLFVASICPLALFSTCSVQHSRVARAHPERSPACPLPRYASAKVNRVPSCPLSLFATFVPPASPLSAAPLVGPVARGGASLSPFAPSSGSLEELNPRASCNFSRSLDDEEKKKRKEKSRDATARDTRRRH